MADVPTRQRKLIDDCGYEALRRLGRGTYGLVLALRRHGATATDPIFAGKLIEAPPSEGVPARSIAEIDVLFRLQHPYLLSGEEIVTRARAKCLVDGILLVLPYGNASLEGYLETARPTIVERLRLLGQIAAGLAFLHANRILHLDIKPLNIIVFREPGGGVTARVGDFGSAMPVDDLSTGATTIFQRITETFAPPEALSVPRGDKIRYTDKTDVWSFGVLMAAVLSDNPLFTGRDSSEWRTAIQSFGEAPEVNRRNTIVRHLGEIAQSFPQVVNIIVRALDPTSEDRPTMAQISAAPLFAAFGPLPAGGFRPAPILGELPPQTADGERVIRCFLSTTDLAELPVRNLFLAVDLFYRGWALGLSNNNPKLLAYVAAWIAIKYYQDAEDEGGIDASNFSDRNGIGRDQLVHLEGRFLVALRGQIWRRNFYAASWQIDQLVAAAPILADPSRYMQVDPAVWAAMWQPPQRQDLGLVTVKNFLRQTRGDAFDADCEGV